MLLEAEKFKKLFKACGVGTWSKLEYENNGIILRITDIKEYSGTARTYFDSNREQVMTGRLFAPLGSYRPFRLRGGSTYKVVTHIEFIKPIPKEVSALVIPIKQAQDLGFFIYSAPMTAGFKGRVDFMVNACRRIEVEDMISLSRLWLFSTTLPIDFKTCKVCKEGKSTAVKEKVKEEKVDNEKESLL